MGLTGPDPIIVIGNVNVDMVMGVLAPWPSPGTEIVLPDYELRPGGAAGNTGLALQAIGAPVRVIANCGTDVLGCWLRETFGVLAQGWPASRLPTTVSVGLTHPDGERTFLTSGGHLLEFDLDTVRQALAPPPRPGSTVLLSGVFLSPRLRAGYPALLAWLNGLGCRVALDTGWPTEGWTEATRREVLEWLPLCHELLLNEAELEALAGAALPEAIRCVAGRLAPGGTVVVKRGADGAEAWTAGQRLHVAAPPVAVVDTIGAGDTFNAGYLWAQLQGRPLAAALEAGVTLASRAISTSPRRYRAEDDSVVRETVP